ncbi:metalloexopeptidase activity [Sparganum proliferum]
MLPLILLLALTWRCSGEGREDPVPNIPDTLKTATTNDILSVDYDVVIFLNDDIFNLEGDFQDIGEALVQYNGLDSTTPKKMQVVPFLKHPNKRMIFAPTGRLNTDISDSRQIYDTAKEAAKLAFSLNLRRPLFMLGPLESSKKANHTWMKGDYPKLLMTLGALQGYYTPYIKRQLGYDPQTKYNVLGIVGADEEFIKIAGSIEMARIVHRDTCASDPERMAAPSIEKYYRREFKSDAVKADYYKMNATRWPLCAAVNRAVQGVDKYEGRVINLEYVSDDFNDTADDTVLFVGKGITYDTGGSELKTGGYMKYMRKDKCGATSIAGFFKALDLLKPKHFKAKAYLAFVRNGIGANAYVFDEIITTRAGIRTRIGSPDAEGRNVMTDMFYDAVQDAEKATHPHIYTIATLTGAVGRAFQHFTAMLGNGPSRRMKNTDIMETAGYNIADFVEKNTLRKEDYEVNRPQTDDEFDLLQFNNAPETAKYRGFQLPAGFMAVGSGLDDWGYQTRKNKIPYTHLDVSASVGVKHMEATGTPTSLFISRYILPKLNPDKFPLDTDPNNY